MVLSRRSFLKRTSTVLGTAAFLDAPLVPQERAADPFSDLVSLTAGIKPLDPEDYQSRHEQARRLMCARKVDALYLNGGTSMEYFGGIRWGVSERMFAMLIPARGEIAYICPKFEEARAREQIRFGNEIRTWEEEESPYDLARRIFQDRKMLSGAIAIEPSVRHFVVDGLQQACPSARFVNGEPITRECRIIKTKKELGYIQAACEITKKAYQAALRTVRDGMSQTELSRNISLAHSRLGAPGGAAVAFGPNAAFPHGSSVQRTLQPGDVILMDGGCRVEGYHSDITRTVVFGRPAEKLSLAWDLVKKAQEAALAAAKPGVPCEALDAAARKVITDGGYGPDYRHFTHRLGHGIGMDGHEHPYLVRGNKLLLEPGMTFSDEPGIYIQGEFGVRLEDIVYIDEDGGHFFGNTSPRLEAY